jgi:hypothetical protein
MGAISSNGISNMSLSTKARRSAGARASSRPGEPGRLSRQVAPRLWSKFSHWADYRIGEMHLQGFVAPDIALTKVGTRLADRGDPVPDAVFDEHYDEAALAALVVCIAAINTWKAQCHHRPGRRGMDCAMGQLSKDPVVDASEDPIGSATCRIEVDLSPFPLYPYWPVAEGGAGCPVLPA